MAKKPVVLIIMDGWGESREKEGNAILHANLPTIQHLNKYYPKVFLKSSGRTIGLPKKVQGNSEVGHQTIGSGQVVFGQAALIDKQIKDGSFFNNKRLIDTIRQTKENGGKLHILGMMSDASVHSNINHFKALLGLTSEMSLNDVYIHAITDGRDVAPVSAGNFFEDILKTTKELKTGRLASMAGRFYTMDRDTNWDRTEEAYKMLTVGSDKKERDPFIALEKQGKEVMDDSYIKPTNFVDKNNKALGLIEPGDSVIFFNYRKDRAIQISSSFANPGFDKFKNTEIVKGINFLGFTHYKKDLPFEPAFPEQAITTRVGEALSTAGKKQLRLAETEKFAHVTFYFNGGIEKALPKEERILIPSSTVPSYREVPEMSAYEITDKFLEVVDDGDYDFILINYANPDLVGHSGDMKATIRAVEVVDECVGKVVKKVLEKDGCVLLGADHGNAEEMFDKKTGQAQNSHTTNPVPYWLISNEFERSKPMKKEEPLELSGNLSDVGPTVLDLCGVKKSKGMHGESLMDAFKDRV